ncbi:MAG TPA: DNA repair protein RecO [Baekduia sp.]|uniref:DNA repair protein RecO n=1 Tax=Baekduia sp. TaxID=2600305 RepID=UPI002D7814B3|nr:DNA repair protein RecO [Baekduia sp.]HET6507478.1 DNA repair protein RecO [Baekduia sp.]
MAGALKTEAVVLRSIRYGEADRILHLYTPQRGRLSGIAKGVRKTRSRFGGRLEPFCRVELVLHEGRSDLLTVTSAQTLAPYSKLRSNGAAIDAAARACDAVNRLFGEAEPSEPVFHLLCNELALLDADAAHAGHANQLAFRLKLLVAGGFAPYLAACASCGERDHLVGFSGAAGGVVCASCEGGGFPLAAETHEFLTAALAQPLAQAPQGSERALRQAERAIAETVEHHAHVRLRAASHG